MRAHCETLDRSLCLPHRFLRVLPETHVKCRNGRMERRLGFAKPRGYRQVLRLYVCT